MHLYAFADVGAYQWVVACGVASLLLLIAVLCAAQTNSGGTPATSGASQAMSARYGVITCSHPDSPSTAGKRFDLVGTVVTVFFVTAISPLPAHAQQTAGTGRKLLYS